MMVVVGDRITDSLLWMLGSYEYSAFDMLYLFVLGFYCPLSLFLAAKSRHCQFLYCESYVTGFVEADNNCLKDMSGIQERTYDGAALKDNQGSSPEFPAIFKRGIE